MRPSPLPLALLLLSACPAESPKSPEPRPPVHTEGENLFAATCANCHGQDGRAVALKKRYPDIPDLTDPALHERLTDEALARTIATGHDAMPGFETLLTEREIREVIAYTRTLRAAEGEPAPP